MADTGESRPTPTWLRAGMGIMAILAIMWGIEIVDTTLLDDDLQSNGIRPRSVNGLDGIAWSPFLHAGFGHLISNSLPFLILSALVLTRGIRRYTSVSVIVIALGGALVWLLAFTSKSNHIGASGWIFGLLGYLIGAVFYERRPLSFLAAAVAVFLYGGTLLSGFLPREGISWEGHLFGFVAGVVAARVLNQRRSHSTREPGT